MKYLKTYNESLIPFQEIEKLRKEFKEKEKAITEKAIDDIKDCFLHISDEHDTNVIYKNYQNPGRSKIDSYYAVKINIKHNDDNTLSEFITSYEDVKYRIENELNGEVSIDSFDVKHDQGYTGVSMDKYEGKSDIDAIKSFFGDIDEFIPGTDNKRNRIISIQIGLIIK